MLVYLIITIVAIIVAVAIIQHQQTVWFEKTIENINEIYNKAKIFIVTFFMVGFAEYEAPDEEETKDNDSEDFNGFI
jgi:hypothetical protein